MKLATLNNHTRDGQLLVVNRELTLAVTANDIAPTLQYAIDHWPLCAPRLQALYDNLNAGKASHTLDFTKIKLMSPLPRAYQWADGSAYVNHVELVRKARGAVLPDNFWHDPLMYQGGSDTFLGPTEAIPLRDENWGLDFEAEVAVITHDVPAGASLQQAQNAICLLMLVNDVSLRNLIPDELAKGFGFYQSKPSSAFSPVAITPDELGDAWRDGKVHLPLVSHLNGQLFGQPNAGDDMTFNFPALIKHAAKTRSLAAGSIIGSGTVSNYDRSKGSSCIAEVRMLETINQGKAVTPFMKAGDKVRIEMFDQQQHSLFGAIEQSVVTTKEEVVYDDIV